MSVLKKNMYISSDTSIFNKNCLWEAFWVSKPINDLKNLQIESLYLIFPVFFDVKNVNCHSLEENSNEIGNVSKYYNTKQTINFQRKDYLIWKQD